jgi:hypothetical protein
MSKTNMTRGPALGTFITSIALLSACGGGGGGGGSSSGGGGPSPPPPPPITLTFTADSALVPSGLAPTLSWRSSGSACTATGGWSGAKAGTGSEQVAALSQTTTYSLSCTGGAAAAANASLTVVATASHRPEPTTSKVWSEENATSLDYARLPYSVRDMAWNKTRKLLYAVTRMGSPNAENSLLAIDPVTLATQVLPLGAEPWTVEISSNDEFVYIAMASTGSVRRVRTSDFTQDLSLTLGTGTTAVQRVIPSPVDPHTFAVLASGLIPRSSGYGVVVYDDATPRSDALLGDDVNIPFQDFIDIDWNADGTVIHAVGSGSSVGFFDLAVDAQGVRYQRKRLWPTASPGTLVGNRYFSTDGRVFNLAGAVDLDAYLPDYYFTTANRVPMPARGKVFSLGSNRDGGFVDGTRIIAFDIDRYTYIDAIVFNGAASFYGAPLVAWGTDGLAIGGPSEMIIAHGSFAASGGVPPASSATLPLRATGVTGNTAMGTVSVRAVDIGARAVTADTCGHLYVTTSSGSPVRPGSVMEVDPATLTITRSAITGVEPYLVSASDDCSTLYVAPYYSSSLWRLRASDLATTGILPIPSASFYTGNPNAPLELTRVRAMSVAPGQAQTVAFSTGDIEYSLCSGLDRGVYIYDGDVPRPVYRPDSTFSIKSIVFGANASVLYGEDFDSVYAFDVSAGGLGNPRAVMPYPDGNTFDYDFGRDLYFDPAANRVYNLFGGAFDAAANTQLPKISLKHTAFTTGCGAPMQARVTDRTTGKLFWVGRTDDSRLGVSTYARNGLALTGSLEIGNTNELNNFGYPQHVARLPNNQLAVVTDGGYLVLLQGTLLAP